EIRFGLGGLKGVGEMAIDNLITERKQNGPYADVFDFVKRALPRAMNKKSMESLAYSGAFDCFPALHRAQYFHTAEGERQSGLEKIMGYGQVHQSLSQGTSNTLFGDLPMAMHVPPCEPWTLTELLEHEKDVTGMFMSGHPLDHFKFELTHYGLTKLQDFNEIKDSQEAAKATGGKFFRLAGLVIDVQHRVTKMGKNFGVLVIEDFSGKSEFMLWSEDYIKFQNYLLKGKNIVLYGLFQQRFRNAEQFEFKIQSVSLLESLKQQMTRSIEISLHPASVHPEMLAFLEQNIRNYPGKSSLRFQVYDPREELRVQLFSVEKCVQMNDELVNYLVNNQDLELRVGLVG
ncbi:MAG: DNA polymerase III subunit alpha, partial [Sphingobacteriia bacterium]